MTSSMLVGFSCIFVFIVIVVIAYMVYCNIKKLRLRHITYEHDVNGRPSKNDRRRLKLEGKLQKYPARPASVHKPPPPDVVEDSSTRAVRFADDDTGPRAGNRSGLRSVGVDPAYTGVPSRDDSDLPTTPAIVRKLSMRESGSGRGRRGRPHSVHQLHGEVDVEDMYD